MLMWVQNDLNVICQAPKSGSTPVLETSSVELRNTPVVERTCLSIDRTVGEGAVNEVGL